MSDLMDEPDGLEGERAVRQETGRVHWPTGTGA